MVGIRFTILPIFILSNLITLVALRRGIGPWVGTQRRKRTANWISLAVLLLNIPLLSFFISSAEEKLRLVPPVLLRIFFYPSTAWLATLMACFLIAIPVSVIWGAGKMVALAGLDPIYS